MGSSWLGRLKRLAEYLTVLSLPSQIKPYQQEGDKKFGLVRRILAPREATTVRTAGEFFLFLIDKHYAFLCAEA
jgi:hypothetical protein